MAVFSLFTLIFLFYFSPEIAAETATQTYIVHVRPYSESRVSYVNEDYPELKLLPGDPASRVVPNEADDYYSSFLPFGIASQRDTKQMVHCYHNVLSGFAARLTAEELKIMEQKDGFISARPEQKFQLHTTHTPNFLGLHSEAGFWKESNFGKGVIVGLLDTGVFPSHPSFSDQYLSPPPAKWKGRCDFNLTDCNNKIIGARNLVTGSENTAPIDDDGHGTHTASTAAGSFVKNAEVLGNAYGTAAGIAPWAHLAIYRVCSIEDCLESDILAGLDAAVEDGVDVISISLGVENPGGPFYLDNIAIGSFRAMQKGIFVSCSAANSGPINSTLANDAPWILTVGASTMDRTIRTTAKLGNGEEFNGESLFQPKNFSSVLVPLVYAGADGKDASPFCAEGSLNGTDVRGKVVLCMRGGGGVTRIGKGEEVKRAGGAAMILMNDPLNAFSTEADPHVLPASHISFADGLKIMEYINSSSAPVATILFKGTIIGSPLSPAVTSFSSRGPSIATPGILKPDIIGPGVSVLAAWPFPLGDSTNPSKATFNIISGTSMSCPHLAGVAALIKSSHPDWSPAAIKSAIMTTADTQNLGGSQILDQSLLPADLFATGAGHVNPSRADNPGLVYDIQPSDYVPYLCGLGYTDEQVGILAQQTVKCANQTKVSEGDLNYPSFSFKLGGPQSFSRVLTNVGHGNSSYEVAIVAPKGVYVRVEPKKLCFSEFNQKLRYSVTLVHDGSDFKGPFAQGYLRWVSAEHSVRSPISVTFR